MKKLVILALCLTLVTPATFAKKEAKGTVKTEQKAVKKENTKKAAKNKIKQANPTQLTNPTDSVSTPQDSLLITPDTIH